MNDFQANPATTNRNEVPNYVKNDAVYILNSIDPVTTNHMISDLSELVRAKISKTSDSDAGTEKTIGVFINCDGGSDPLTMMIEGQLALAKYHKIIIQTHVFGTASSNASLLAVQGTPGYRIMGEYSRHFVHFGNMNISVKNESEISKVAKPLNMKNSRTTAIYLSNTSITPKQLKSIMRDEFGYLTAEDCLRLGFCDKVLTNNGCFESAKTR